MALWLIMQLAAVAAGVPCHLPADGGPVSATLQACIDRAGAGERIEVAPGTWVLDRQLLIRKTLTLATTGVAAPFATCRANPGACATFIASPDFSGDGGLLRIESADAVRLEHLVIDGNRAARLASPAAAACAAGNNRAGYNASAEGCADCALFDVVSQNALCGTGFEWTGRRARIEQSTFRDNGDAGNRNMWADGLTALHVPGSHIAGNEFSDNSDIGLIVGHAPGSLIARNRIVQRRQHAFAGLMLDNFNSGDLEERGDFRGAVVTANSVDCGREKCGFGINLGPHAWYDSRNIVGGEVMGNTVSGANVGISIDGAGTEDWPIEVYSNTVRLVREAASFPLCHRMNETSALDVAPDSVVNRRGDSSPYAQRRDWHACQ
jgi:hypothetical protein